MWKPHLRLPSLQGSTIALPCWWRSSPKSVLYSYFLYIYYSPKSFYYIHIFYRYFIHLKVFNKTDEEMSHMAIAVIDLNTLIEIVFNFFFGAASALLVRTKRYITIRSLQCIPLFAPNPILPYFIYRHNSLLFKQSNTNQCEWWNDVSSESDESNVSSVWSLKSVNCVSILSCL